MLKVTQVMIVAFVTIPRFGRVESGPAKALMNATRDASEPTAHLETNALCGRSHNICPLSQ